MEKMTTQWIEEMKKNLVRVLAEEKKDQYFKTQTEAVNSGHFVSNYCFLALALLPFDVN